MSWIWFVQLSNLFSYWISEWVPETLSDRLVRPSTLGLGLCVLSRRRLSDNWYGLQFTIVLFSNNSSVNQRNPCFLAASSDTTARLWTMQTGEAIRVYQGHHKATTCCALHDGAESAPAWALLRLTALCKYFG
jgi:WD40 repeat protein